MPCSREFESNPSDGNGKYTLVTIFIDIGPSFISMCLVPQIFKNFNDLFFALIFKDLHL